MVTGGHPAGALEWGRFAPATPLAGADLEARIRGWKEGDGGDIITFGSPTLVQYLTNAGLVDEYHIIVHPVVVPEGQRLFDNLDARTDLRLVSAETLAHGAILVKYATLDG